MNEQQNPQVNVTGRGVTCVPLDREYVFRIHLQNLTSYDCDFPKDLSMADIKIDFQDGVLKVRVPRALETEGDGLMGTPARQVWRPTESPYPQAS